MTSMAEYFDGNECIQMIEVAKNRRREIMCSGVTKNEHISQLF